MGKMMRKVLVAALAALSLAACNDDSTEPANGPVFVIEAAGQEFKVLIGSSTVAAQARQLIGSNQSININGEIARGNGGFNTGYSWHLKPNTVEFADMTIEVCDGEPSFVEENVDYFVDTVKRYCPWGIKVKSEVSQQ